MTEEEAKQTLIQIFFVINRLGVNTKKETHGLGVGMVTWLHVWAMEDSTRHYLSVEVFVVFIHVVAGHTVRQNGRGKNRIN